jgi:5-methylcytosine-specific restriction endonuclease McrA
MSAQEICNSLAGLAQTISEADDRLQHAKRTFCQRALEHTATVARLRYVADGDQRQASIRLLIGDLAEACDDVRSAMNDAACDFLSAEAEINRLHANLVEAWNGQVSIHAEHLQEAKRETSLAHMQVRAMENRKREHAINSPEVRQKVWEITDGHCIYCDVEMVRERDPSDPDRCFEVDHIVARSNGGPDHLSNYVPACHKCNTSKSAKSIFRFLVNRQALPGLRVVGGSEA